MSDILNHISLVCVVCVGYLKALEVCVLSKLPKPPHRCLRRGWAAWPWGWAGGMAAGGAPPALLCRSAVCGVLPRLPLSRSRRRVLTDSQSTLTFKAVYV